MQIEYHTNKEEILKIFRRHTLEAFFQVMRVAVNYCKRQKQVKIIALHPNNTVSRAPKYGGTYPKKLLTASPGNPVGFTRQSSFSFFVKIGEKVFGKVDKLQGKLFFGNFRQKNYAKSSLGVQTCIKTYF